MTPVHHQNPATWECKYGVVFIPKYRKKALFGITKKRLGDVFHELARRRESKIEEGHLMPDHVHMLISIPPKYCVAEVIGFIKGGEFDLDRAECRAQSAQFHTSSGLGAISSRRQGGTRKPFGPPSRTKSCKIANWTSLLSPHRSPSQK